ncbi:putative BRCA1-A complex subunit BRE-like [Capsicum annuum]|nr:putative BRCA1-A complex subunit BRE-like [Capsicum annuum]
MKKKGQNSQLFLLTNNSSNEDEFEVANILLDLDNLVIQRQFGSLIWGCKKKRSNRCIDFSSSSVCIQQQQGCLKVDDEHHEIDKAKIKVEVVTSPATPLSFSPSESDDKSKHSSRKSYKRKKREELMDNIKELSQCREMLRGEVENVRNYYNNLKAYNLKLKARKEQVTKMLNIQGGGVNLGQLYNNSGMEPNHQQPFIMDQVAIHRYQYPLGQVQQQAQPFFSNRLGLGLGPGPMVLPDLNVSVDEAFTLDRFDIDRMNVERKAQFAEARRRRRIKRIEVKNSSGFIRPPRRR